MNLRQHLPNLSLPATRSRRASLALACLALCLVGMASYLGVAHAVHRRHLVGQVGLCSARTTVNFNRFDHALSGLYGMERSLDDAIGHIDQASAALDEGEKGILNSEDNVALGYLRLCGDALREERQLLALAEAFQTQRMKILARSKDGAYRPEDDLNGDGRVDYFERAMAQRKRVREALTELENHSAGMVAVLPEASLVDPRAIIHLQHELESFWLGGTAR